MRLTGCEIKNIRPIFRAEMLINQPKAILGEKILCGKITHHLKPENGKTARLGA